MVTNKKRSKFLILIILLAIGVGGGVLLYQNLTSSSDNNWKDGVNYNPPTKEEQKDGDEKKKDIVDEENQQKQDQSQQQTQQAPVTKKTVDVAISDAGQYGDIVEVRSFIPSYSQDGTCTLTLTQGAHSFTRTTPAYKDISSTICPTIKIKISDFPSGGSWQAVVSFESTNAKGQSEPRTFTVEK